ncbi:MAG: hypothetical protein WCO58_02880 [bacterium]
MHNNPNQKHHIPSLLIVICVILFSALSLLFRKDVVMQKEQQQTPVVEDIPVTTQPKLSYCGLTVNTPTPQEMVTFPYTLQASWKNDKATTGCVWTVFEAQLAVVSVFDGSNKKIASGLLKVAEGTDWMNGQPFDAQANLELIDPKTELKSGANLMIVIDEENPSDSKNSKQMRIPVVVK